MVLSLSTGKSIDYLPLTSTKMTPPLAVKPGPDQNNQKAGIAKMPYSTPGYPS
jgi:hypothetical protein